MNGSRFIIVGIGEALYDVFPDHRQIGGAPLNLALCADQLAKPHGGAGVMVSRVGQDEAGEHMLATLRERGLNIDYIQTDPDRPTGTVIVDLDDEGQPNYQITRGVAWDVIQYDPDLEDLARSCDAVAFGSLAQRDGQSRNTIYRFLDAAQRAVRLFDVNLRQDFFDRHVIHRSLEYATIVKANEQELPRIVKLLGIGGEGEAAELLRRKYDLEMVAVTRGEEGMRLYAKDAVIDGAAASYEPADRADSVGAGDASAAGLLVGRVLRRSKQQIADLANRCGAFAVSQPGGTAKLPEELIQSV